MGVNVFKAFSFVPHILLIVLLIVSVAIEEPKNVSRQEKSQYYLKQYVSIIITTVMYMYAVGHIIMADRVAKSIGWTTGSPFQKEVAFANLSIAVGATYVTHNDLSIDAHKSIVLTFIAWLAGTLLVHIVDMFQHNNYNFNNLVGAPLFSVMAIVLGGYLIIAN